MPVARLEPVYRAFEVLRDSTLGAQRPVVYVSSSSSSIATGHASPPPVSHATTPLTTTVCLGRNSKTQIADPCLSRLVCDVYWSNNNTDKDSNNSDTATTLAMQVQGHANRSVFYVNGVEHKGKGPVPLKTGDRLALGRNAAGFVYEYEVVLVPNNGHDNDDDGDDFAVVQLLETAAQAIEEVASATAATTGTGTNTSNNSPRRKRTNAAIVVPVAAPSNATATSTTTTTARPSPSRKRAAVQRPACLEEFNCEICLDLIVQPVTLMPCGHSMCRQCWHDYKANTCPTCNTVCQHAGVSHKLNNVVAGFVECNEATGYFTADDVQHYQERVGLLQQATNENTTAATRDGHAGLTAQHSTNRRLRRKQRRQELPTAQGQTAAMSTASTTVGGLSVQDAICLD